MKYCEYRFLNVQLQSFSSLLIHSTRHFIVSATGFHSAGVQYGVTFQQHSGCLESNREVKGKIRIRALFQPSLIFKSKKYLLSSEKVSLLH